MAGYSGFGHNNVSYVEDVDIERLLDVSSGWAK